MRSPRSVVIGALALVVGLSGAAAAAAAAPGATTVHLTPVSTSTDRAPVCAPPAPGPEVHGGPGVTTISFVLVAPGCD